MCRHLAYLGEEVTIRSLLFDPPHGLVRQAWAPRRQKHGTMNADGFGVGWYAGSDPLPARYRRAGPIWSDECLPDLARVTRTKAMLAAVRSATAGTDMGAASAAPYAEGRWLFSLNGALIGWSSAAGAPAAESESGVGPDLTDGAAAVLKLAGQLSAAEMLALAARCDSALLWGLVLQKLRGGQRAADALAGTVADIWAAGGTGRFNMLLTDGQQIAATAAGDSLCYRHGPDGVLVVSEPSDEEPGWHEVPDASVISATRSEVKVLPIEQAQAEVQTAYDGKVPRP